MSTEFYELIRDQEVADETGLKIARAKQLAAAVNRNRDYTALQYLRRQLQDGEVREYLIVDVETDGVPSRNPVGIRYRERLAIEVPSDTTKLVRVLALRRDFPMLMHQNQTLPAQPRDLCLHFEPPKAVLRGWTPERFLRRIQWWLEMASQGRLHAADQPVEQLFYVTKYELVLPWDANKVRLGAGKQFILSKSARRPDGGQTFFLEDANGRSASSSTAVVELDLPPLVQGQVIAEPATLGQLSDALEGRHIDLLSPLKQALEARVGPQGQDEAQGGSLTLLLLRVPVARAEGCEPERVQRRAYVALGSANKLGVATGALFMHSGRFFRSTGVLGAEEANGWREQVLVPAEVQYQNCPEEARKQSGITTAGPAGTLVGAGSLGSLMLNFWTRCGWGQWTVVDPDHVKPHNLSRHTALACHVGTAKVDAVVDLHSATMGGAGQMKAVYGDATDLDNKTVRDALDAAELVVDASTTLEYPRLASEDDTLPRHVSTFLTPSGRGAVLLAEDRARKTRLRTLEAQYYRAVIREAWGRAHLEGNLGTFWSGASCRDISTVMPYTSVAVHAGTLAEQVQQAAQVDGAVLRVWQRDIASGSTQAIEVGVEGDRCLTSVGPKLYVDAALERRLHELRASGLPNETGGILLGYHDFNVDAVVVVDALPAPSDSKASPAAFERGVAGLADAVQEASRRTAGIVSYIGEWHSHPPGHSTSPSRDDLIQLIHLALGMSEDGLPAVQLIVGDTDVQVLQGIAL